jgi:predicted metal-dependent hydrolase
MKQKGIDGAKQILCIIYGMLAEKHKIKNIIQYSKEDNEINYKIPKDCVTDTIKQISNDKIKIIYKQIDNLYDGPLPRAINWITSLMRKLIYDTVGNNIKNVKMILTDGIYTDAPIFHNISVLPNDKKLGDLVREGYYKDIKIIKGGSHKIYEKVKY